MLMGFIQLFAMALAMVPVAFFGACAWVLAGRYDLPPIWQSALGVSVGGFMLFMEAGLGVVWLGRLYDNFDLSEERT